MGFNTGRVAFLPVRLQEVLTLMWIRQKSPALTRRCVENARIFENIRLRLEKQNEKPALTEVIISQHLLDFLGDGVRVELGGHGHHLLDAQARVARYGQRGGQLGLPARGVLGQRLHGGGRLGGQRVAGEPVDRLLGRTEGRLWRRAATGRRLRRAVCLSGTDDGGGASETEREMAQVRRRCCTGRVSSGRDFTRPRVNSFNNY